MNKHNNLIRHKILNILTQLLYLITGAPLAENEKELLLRQTKLISLLVAEENLFLGGERKFLLRNVDLNEILELVRVLLNKPLKKKQIELNMPHTAGIFVHVDRDVLIAGLEQILLKLIESSNRIQVTMVGANSALSIRYDSNQPLEMGKESLIRLLKKGAEPQELIFHATVYLMKLSGIKLTFRRGLIKMAFGTTNIPTPSFLSSENPAP